MWKSFLFPDISRFSSVEPVSCVLVGVVTVNGRSGLSQYSTDLHSDMLSLLSFTSLLVLVSSQEPDYSDWYYLKLVTAEDQDFNVTNETLAIGDCQGERLNKKMNVSLMRIRGMGLQEQKPS